MYIINPVSINSEVLKARFTSASSLPTLGINLKKRKALKTLKILKTSRKLTSNTCMLKINEINAGTDTIIKIKSSLFQPDLK